MGSIRERTNAKGQTTYQALIAVQRKGTTYRDSQTFERRPLAVKWMKEREAELKAPDAILSKAKDTKTPTLGDALDAYLKDTEGQLGRTKKYTLDTIRKDVICDLDCDKVTSVELRKFMDRRTALGNAPATVANYLAHLSTVFKLAQDAYCEHACNCVPLGGVFRVEC